MLPQHWYSNQIHFKMRSSSPMFDCYQLFKNHSVNIIFIPQYVHLSIFFLTWEVNKKHQKEVNIFPHSTLYCLTFTFPWWLNLWEICNDGGTYEYMYIMYIKHPAVLAQDTYFPLPTSYYLKCNSFLYLLR